MITPQNRQGGGAHLVLMLIAVVVLAVIGFSGWQVIHHNDTKPTQDSGTTTDLSDKSFRDAAKAECRQNNDPVLCKFFAAWQSVEQYRMTSDEQNGEKVVLEVDGNRNRITAAGRYAFEVVSEGNTTYTKAGDSWYRQTVSQSDLDVVEKYKDNFVNPAGSSQAADKTAYTALGKEACGGLSCFKYEANQSGQLQTRQLIWFDDKDYLLRQSSLETTAGTSRQVFDYAEVNVDIPSPVKQLSPDQVLIPGQSAPISKPSAGSR